MELMLMMVPLLFFRWGSAAYSKSCRDDMLWCNNGSTLLQRARGQGEKGGGGGGGRGESSAEGQLLIRLWPAVDVTDYANI